MMVVSSSSVDKYGDSAFMHGLNMSFAAMSVSALLLVVLAVVGTGKNR
jgi:uncharacterized membrane protein YqjE